jgi:hypothetical protein
MNVIDDIKDKISSGSNSSRSLESDFNDSLNDSGSMDDLGSSGMDNSGPDLDSGLGNQQNNNSPPDNNNPNGQQPQARQNQKNPAQDLNNNQTRNNSHNSGRNQQRNNSNTQNQRGGQTHNKSPNPQTGRPQPGQNSPQLSSNTKKKMQNAGMDPSDPQSVSDQSSDLQEIKRQNEQIIDLLKRLNKTLNNI